MNLAAETLALANHEHPDNKKLLDDTRSKTIEVKRAAKTAFVNLNKRISDAKNVLSAAKESLNESSSVKKNAASELSELGVRVDASGSKIVNMK